MRDISTGPDTNIWQVLAKICPVNEIMVIGALPELSKAIFEATRESAVVLVDARPLSKRAFSRLLEGHSNAEILDIIVAPESEERTFFDLSIKSESGLICPDSLSRFWPNIHAKAQNRVQAEGMIEVLERMSTDAPWLILNRLDSLALCSRIEDWEELPRVIIARAVLDEGSELAKDLSSVPMLIERLHSFGYENIAVLADTHPQLRQVVFARATSQVVEETNRQLQEQTRQADEQIAALTSELAQYRTQLREAQSQLSLRDNNLQDLRRKHHALTQQSDQQNDSISNLKEKLLKLQDLLTQRSQNQLDDM